MFQLLGAGQEDYMQILNILILILTLLPIKLFTEGSGEHDALGRKLFELKCAYCHGEKGDGMGLAQGFIDPQPTDLTSGVYKIRTTETGSIPTDSDISRTITKGIHGSAMPAWAPFITGDSLGAIVDYVKSLSSRFKEETTQKIIVGRAIASSERSISNGRKIYNELECYDCHGEDGTSKGDDVFELEDDMEREIKAANLTEPWTFKGGSASKDIYIRLVTGMNGTPMPSYDETVSERQLWDLANYVVAMARKPVWEMSADELWVFYSALEGEAIADPIERGKYLVETLGCVHCHTPFDKNEMMMKEFEMAGGALFSIGPWGDIVTRNLTSDKETGLGNATDEQIKEAITRGIKINGERMLPFPMGWPAYAGLSDYDLNALIDYLRSIPPIYNKIPDVKKKNPIAYLWAKFDMLILKNPMLFGEPPGNSGDPNKPADM